MSHVRKPVSVPLLLAALCVAITQFGSNDGIARSGSRDDARLMPGPPDGVDVPPRGSFNLRWIAEHMAKVACRVPGIYMGSGHYPMMTYVQVDYAGPKPFVEFAIVNRDGEKTTEKTLMRFPYGAAALETKGNSTRYYTTKPFTYPRQTFCVRWHSLPDCGDNNALLSVLAFPSDTQELVEGFEAVFYASQFDPRRTERNGSFTAGNGELSYRDPFTLRPPFVGPKSPQPDSDPVTILTSKSGSMESRIVMRFAD